MGRGTITSYALMSLEPRGTLFVQPGMEVGSKLLFFPIYHSLYNYMSCFLLQNYEQQRATNFF